MTPIGVSLLGVVHRDERSANKKLIKMDLMNKLCGSVDRPEVQEDLAMLSQAEANDEPGNLDDLDKRVSFAERK